tara:strand:- start:328 stop:975 length:648 start_codon:yes stop_codon:yes gene_type:complete
MKSTQTRQYIEEEIQLMIENGELDEGYLDRLRAKAAGLSTQAKGALTRGAVSGAGKFAGVFDPKTGQKLKKMAGDIEAQTKTAASAQIAKKLLSLKLPRLKKVYNDLEKDITLMYKDKGQTPPLEVTRAARQINAAARTLSAILDVEADISQVQSAKPPENLPKGLPSDGDPNAPTGRPTPGYKVYGDVTQLGHFPMGEALEELIKEELARILKE